jgi:hypothetical protein
MGRYILINHKWLLFSMVCLCLLLLGAKPDLPITKGEEDPMERREEKLKAFRGKRDQFFKEDPHSPLKEADRKRFKGLNYYTIDLRYAMIGLIERYPIEPKPIYANLPTSKGNERTDKRVIPRNHQLFAGYRASDEE